MAVVVMLAGCGKMPPPPVKPATPPATTTTTQPVVAPPVQPPVVPVQPPAPVEPKALPVSTYSVPESTIMPPDYVAPADKHVEVYGNYHTAGVIADIPDGLTGDQIWMMKCYLNVNGTWKPMQDLVQVRDYAWFATSIFWLQPDSAYQVKVVVIDRQNKIRASWYGEGRTRKDPVIPSTDKNVYVATTGNDANPGTKEQPFRTIEHAMTNAVAGMTIWVNGGVYYEGNLVFEKNGAPGRPIVLRAVPGQSAVMDGSDPALTDGSAWKKTADGLYMHAFPYAASTCPVLEDRQTGARIRLMPVHTRDELRRRAIKKWAEDVPDYTPFAELDLAGGVFCDGKDIYMALPGPIEKYKIHISRLAKGLILENRHDIMVDGLTFRYNGNVDYAGAMFLNSSSDILVQNCLIDFCDSGMGIKRNSNRVTIQDCRFVDVTGGFPFIMLKMGGAPAAYETGAVIVDAKYSGRGLVFRRNRIEGYFDGAHLTPWTEDDARSNETDFYHNYLDVCLDDFMEIDGYARNVRVFENYMDRSLSGISLAQALDGPTFIVYNVIANCGMVRSAIKEENAGYPFKTNGGYEMEVGTGPVFFYNNTAWTADPQSRAMLVKRALWSKITFRNNIWCGNAMGFETWESPPSPMDFDYDNLYVSDTNAPLVLMGYHTRFDTLQDVQKKLRWLRHGISADPKLASPRQDGNFRLTDGSPCVDAGTPVPGITDGRILGAAPDMGAYELR
jgi:hypothetical protein